MSQATKGSTVKVHYTGTLTDNTVFDSSREREPIEFTVGAGQMIKGFDAAVDGMSIGDAKKVTIPADEAYGPRVDEAVFPVPKKRPSRRNGARGRNATRSETRRRTQSGVGCS